MMQQGQSCPELIHIFGTGTNCVYLEQLSNIAKPLEGSYDSSTGEMFISTEWGSFDNQLLVLPNTKYDIELDRGSLNPGNQMFEKRVAGMFLGELLRIIASHMYMDPSINLFAAFRSNNERNLGEHQLPLLTPWSVDSSILSIAEADNSNKLESLRASIVAELGVPTSFVSVEDAQAVKIIAHAIGKRAARLAGMAVGAVILKRKRENKIKLSMEGHVMKGVADDNNSPKTTVEIIKENEFRDSNKQPIIIDIAVDGSLIEFYPNFEKYMRQAIRLITEKIGGPGEEKIHIEVAKDGSSVGTAITAPLASQQGAVSNLK